jgi:hypothetical protein
MNFSPPAHRRAGMRWLAACGVLAALLLLLAVAGHFVLRMLVLD